ncbi:hypothetical protein Ancab_012812 [Ancistrocladus abbreviatus]
MWSVRGNYAAAATANALLIPTPISAKPFASKSLTFSSFRCCGVPNKLKKPQSINRCSVKCSAANNGMDASDEHQPQQCQEKGKGSGTLWEKWKANSAEMSRKLAKLGLAAVLAYGLFDGVIYTTFFVLAFLGYEKSTGKNPAANLQALLGIVILMWTGNNVTRPFRVAGAAALAPVIDKGLRRIQKAFNFPNLVHAFAFVASIVATLCFTVVGLLILSRWGK